MENNKITLYPSNWLYNAGVLGLLRILEFAKMDNSFKFKMDGSVEIGKSALDNFEIYYFEYVTKIYLMQRISLRELINFIRKNFESKETGKEENEIKKTEIKVKEIEDEIRRKILSINANEKWDVFINEIDTIRKELKEKIREEIEGVFKDKINRKKIEKINDRVCRVFEGIENFKAQGNFLQAFYFNKGSLANPSDKIQARPENFRKKYLDPITKIKNGDNLCIFCGKNYSEEDISKLTEEDFSVLGVSSSSFANFYNYYVQDGLSYNRKCSLCQLILLCAFAGFNLKPFQIRELDETEYIFVNYPSFKEAYYVNNRLQEEFKNYQFGIFTEKLNTYLKSLEYILEIAENKTRWLLENIYFAEIKTSMRKDQVKPKFVYFNIDKSFAEVFSEFKGINILLKNLSFRYEIQKNNSIYLSTEVLKRVLDKKPLIYIALKMFSEKLSEKDTDMNPVWSLILLEFLINQKRRSNMSAKTSYWILKGILEAGKTSFSLNEIDQDKRFHIAQRFLTLIRGARKEDFYNELLRLFVVYEKPVPENLFSLLTESEEITFQEKALAFLTGFINPSGMKIIETIEEKKEGDHE